MFAKGRMEKYIIRKAFDIAGNAYLPDSILWRQKEQFSDGVGYNWIDTLKGALMVVEEQGGDIGRGCPLYCIRYL